MKSRGVYETPGMTILQPALERSSRSHWIAKSSLEGLARTEVAEMIYYGFWYSPEFEAIAHCSTRLEEQSPARRD